MTNSVKKQFDLTGKVALVTGASKGIGLEIARALAECGAQVIVSSRKQAAVDAVAAELSGAGYKAAAIACHVGDIAAARGLVDQTIERFGGVDVIVNNAASNPVFGPVIHADDTVFDKIFGVNLRAPLEIAKQAFESMSQRGGGSIINISSVGGLSPEPMLGLYSVSKAALISLTKVLAKEWGPANIRANVICPGLVKTKFSAALWGNDEILNEFLRTVPLGRIAQPEEIAPLALFLASDAGRYCTGGVYTVDGGSTI